MTFLKSIFIILGDIRGHDIDIELDKECKLSKNLKSLKKSFGILSLAENNDFWLIEIQFYIANIIVGAVLIVSNVSCLAGVYILATLMTLNIIN